MRNRLLPRAVALTTAATLGGLGLSALAPAASAAAPAKPYDFNGDGYADLAVGSPNGKVGSKSGAGFVTVIYGSAAGLNTGKRQVLSQDTNGVGGAAEPGDHFGYAVTSADLDKNGRADLVVSAPDEDAGNLTNSGAMTVFWGTASGLSTQAVTAAPESGMLSGDRAGLTLTAGNLNNNGLLDFAWTGATAWGWIAFTDEVSARSTSSPRMVHHRMPAPVARKGPRVAAAPVVTAAVSSGNVTRSGYQNTVLTWKDPSQPDPVNRNVIVVLGPDESNFNMLTSKATVSAETGVPVVGDFDGDGFGEVAVGQLGDAGHTGGQVTVYKGSANGITADDKTVLHADTPGIGGARVAADHFGADLSAADVNKDGKADLAVAIPDVKVGAGTRAGGVHVLYGSAAGLTGNGSHWMSQDTSGVPGGAEKNDRFGYRVTLLDHTKDGYADLVAGAPGENGTEGSITLLKGRAAGIRPISGSLAWGPGTFGVSGKYAQLGGVLGD